MQLRITRIIICLSFLFVANNSIFSAMSPISKTKAVQSAEKEVKEASVHPSYLQDQKFQKKFKKLQSKIQKKQARQLKKGKSPKVTWDSALVSLLILTVGFGLIILGALIPGLGVLFIIAGVLVALVGLILLIASAVY